MKKFAIAPKEARLLIYNVASIVGIILAGFGLVKLETFQGIVDQVMVVAFPLITALLGQLAAKNVHGGSDSTVTVEDVMKAQESNNAQTFVYEGRHRKTDAELAAEMAESNSIERYISEQRSE